MPHGAIIAIVICLAIFVGSLEQARILMRRQTTNPKSAFEARRNTLRGDLAALILGINQVQGYINQVKEEQTEDAAKVAAEAQTRLNQAIAIKQEAEVSLEKADSETAVSICALRLDMARFHVRSARTLIENHKAANDEDPDGDR